MYYLHYQWRPMLQFTFAFFYFIINGSIYAFITSFILYFQILLIYKCVFCSNTRNLQSRTWLNSGTVNGSSRGSCTWWTTRANSDVIAKTSSKWRSASDVIATTSQDVSAVIADLCKFDNSRFVHCLFRLIIYCIHSHRLQTHRTTEWIIDKRRDSILFKTISKHLSQYSALRCNGR